MQGKRKIRFLGMMVVLGLAIAAVSASVPGWAAKGAAPNAVFNALGFRSPADKDSRGTGVSADGTKVVGYYNYPSPRGFVWDSATGQAVELDANQWSLETYGWCISADGQFVTGRAWYDQAAHRAYFWSLLNGAYVPTALPDLPGSLSTILPDTNVHAYGMTPDASVLVGVGESARGVEACRWTATILEDGTRTWTIESLGDLPGGSLWAEAYACSADGLIVVGQGTIKRGTHGFRWVNGTMTDLGTLPKLSCSAAWSCSADGSVVVGKSYNTQGKDDKAFLWQNGTMTAVPDLSGGKTMNEATAISPDGQYIVGWGTTAAGTEAYIYNVGTQMLNTVKALLQSQGGVLPAGWVPQYACAVTNTDANGQITIVGRGKNPQGKIEGYRAVITP
jgi:probable HAF family extracellular repeat protein